MCHRLKFITQTLLNNLINVKCLIKNIDYILLHYIMALILNLIVLFSLYVLI
jgi:hypothetical protein